MKLLALLADAVQKRRDREREREREIGREHADRHT